MNRKTHNTLTLILVGVIAITASMVTLTSCGGNSSKSQEKELKVDDAAFYATQPLHSGLYDAEYYDITGGNNPRKGMFDGRIYFSLSPETSAFYVFENGNRTKIDYTVVLQKPFEKTDSGTYVSIDSKNRPVSIAPDSTYLLLDFMHGSSDVKITFNSKPRHEGSAIEILEKINAQKNK